MRKILIIVALAFGLSVIALPAQADHSTNPNTAELDHVQQSHSSDCGVAAVTLTVPEGTPEWNYRLQVEVDGEIAGQTDLVQGPGTSTFELAFDEDASDGEVDVRYYYLDAQEWDIVDLDLNRKDIWPAVGDAFTAFTVVTDCEDDPEPTTEPTSGPDPDPTVEPTETKAPAVVPTSVPAGLPDTGPDAGTVALMGFGALAGGGLLFWLRRTLSH